MSSILAEGVRRIKNLDNSRFFFYFNTVLPLISFLSHKPARCDVFITFKHIRKIVAVIKTTSVGDFCQSQVGFSH